MVLPDSFNDCACMVPRSVQHYAQQQAYCFGGTHADRVTRFHGAGSCKGAGAAAPGLQHPRGLCIPWESSARGGHLLPDAPAAGGCVQSAGRKQLVSHPECAGILFPSAQNKRNVSAGDAAPTIGCCPMGRRGMPPLPPSHALVHLCLGHPFPPFRNEKRLWRGSKRSTGTSEPSRAPRWPV